MASTVLVVEDDLDVSEAVAGLLEASGYQVATARDGAAAVERMTTTPIDLVVLEVKLPGADGFAACTELRAISPVPIVILSDRASSADVVRALNLGADDYLTKPFDPAVLMARVRAVLRRYDDEAQPVVTEVRDLLVDEGAFRTMQRGSELPLTTIEMRLMAELAREAGLALTREVLLERVWGYDYLGDSRLVDMAVKRLRDKLGEPDSGVPYITTVRGVGYRLERDDC